MAAIKGTVKRIELGRGFGFIRGADGGEYFFHWTALRNATFDDLREGVPVTFEEEPSERGLRARHVQIDG